MVGSPLKRFQIHLPLLLVGLCLGTSPNWAVAADDPKQVAADKKQEKEEKKEVPLDAKAPEKFNQLEDPIGRVKPLAKRPPTPKLELISSVTRDLADEARKDWKRDRVLRRYSDYSSRVQFGLSNRQLIAALLKRQDSHPTVDAYVRWQLLSFAPDLSEARDIELRRMVALMPDLTQLPAPPKAGNILKGENGSGAYFFSGRQRAFLSDLVPVPGSSGANPRLGVISSGAGISAATFDPQKAIETARGHTYDFVKSVATVEYLNGPAIHYRDAFVRMLPTAEGFRLEVMFNDMKDRIEAGDPGYKTAAQAFFNEAQRTRTDQSISPRTRAKLVYNMRVLARKRTSVVRAIQIDDAGNMREEHDVVAFPEKFVAPLIANLKGEEDKAEDEKKEEDKKEDNKAEAKPK